MTYFSFSTDSFNFMGSFDVGWMFIHYSMLLLTNFLRTFLLKRIMEQFLMQGKGKGKGQKAGFYVYFLLSSVCYEILGLSIVYEVWNCLGLLTLTLLYRETWKKRIWVSLVLLSMDMACFLAAFFAFTGDSNYEFLPQIMAVQVLLLLVCTLLITHFIPAAWKELADRGEIDLDMRQTYILTSIPVTEILVLCLPLYGGFRGLPAILICLSTLLVNLSVFYLYHVMLLNFAGRMENDIYRQQVYAYQNQLDVIQESQNRIRTLKHDMKNHILSLQTLLGRGNLEEMEKYLSSMQDFMANPSEYVTTGNDSIDSLLNYKIQSAKERLDAVETKISIPEKLMLQSFDLNVVLGNLLDNAIDAAMQTEERKLRMTMKLEKGILFLNLCNSCQGIAEGKKGSLETTKADRENHGMGLSSVRRIVEKYHGDMELFCENGNMEVDVIMYMKGL